MTDNHEEYADWASAYTLGALDSAERKTFEQHLSTCSTCIGELALLAPLPGLIAKVEPGDLAIGTSTAKGLAVQAAAGRELREIQKRSRMWRLTAAVATSAAALLAVMMFVGGDSAPISSPVAASLTTNQAETALVATSAKAWGTEITISLTGIPPRSSYRLWAIDTSGNWSNAASWSTTPNGATKLIGATEIPAADLERILITSEDPEDVLVAATA